MDRHDSAQIPIGQAIVGFRLDEGLDLGELWRRFPNLARAPSLAEEIDWACSGAALAIASFMTGRALEPFEALNGGAQIGGAAAAALLLAPDWDAAKGLCAELLLRVPQALSEAHLMSFGTLLRGGLETVAQARAMSSARALDEVMEELRARAGGDEERVDLGRCALSLVGFPEPRLFPTSVAQWGVAGSVKFAELLRPQVEAAQLERELGPERARAAAKKPRAL